MVRGMRQEMWPQPLILAVIHRIRWVLKSMKACCFKSQPWDTPFSVLCTHRRLHNHLMSLNRCITVWKTWKCAMHGVTKTRNNCCWSYKVRKQRKLKISVFQFFLFHTHSLLFGGTWQAVLPTGNHQATKWNWEINIINAFILQTLIHNTEKNPFVLHRPLWSSVNSFSCGCAV